MCRHDKETALVVAFITNLEGGGGQYRLKWLLFT